MNRSNSLTISRIAATVLVGFLATPLSGASTIATTQQESVAMRASATTGISVPFAAGEPGLDGERLQHLALLASADGNDISRSLLTRFPPTSLQASRPETSMGLQLPEPGPLSAIIATLALAGFVMVRRFV